MGRRFFIPQVSSTMAFCVTKSKASPKAPLADTAAAGASTLLSPAEDLAGDLHDIYNDLLSAKTALLGLIPGSGCRQVMIDMEKALVHAIHFKSSLSFIYKLLLGNAPGSYGEDEGACSSWLEFYKYGVVSPLG